MTSHLTATRFGREAFDALSSLIAEFQLDDPLAPVTVIVPGHAHSVVTRRALARSAERGLGAVDFVTISQLAGRIAGARLKSGDGEALLPSDLAAVTGFARKVLSDEPGIFAPTATHPATAEALAAAHFELRDVASESLDELAAGGARAAEVVRVHRAITRLSADGWFDASQAIATAADLIKENPPRGVPSLFIVQLPEPLREPERKLILSLAEHAQVHVIAANSGDVLADEQLASSLAKVELELAPAATAQLPAATSIITTSDADDEVRFALRGVIDALRDGVPARRIAVVFASSDPYSRLLAEQLRAAGITFNGPSGRTVNEMASARFLLRFMHLNPDRILRSEFFALLSSAPVRLPDGSRVPLRRWRHLARKHYANGSAANWIDRLRAAAQDYRSRADEVESDDSDDGPDTEYLHRNAAAAAAFAEFVAQLEARRRAMLRATTWTELVNGHLEMLDEYLRANEMPPEDRAAHTAMREALGGLLMLDELAVPATCDELAEMLLLATERRQIRTGTAGVGVRLLDLRHAAGLDADVVVICGCVEGHLPKRPGVDPLLPGPDRDRLHSMGAEIRVPREFVPRQHRDFLAAIAGAGDKLVLTMPRGDLRKTTRHVPSRWLLEIAAQLTGKELLQPREFEALTDHPTIRHVQSFGSGLAALENPATAQEYRLRQAEIEPPAESPDTVLARNANLVIARRSRAFTRFDGNLAGAPLPEITERILSATRLEGYIACPHSIFMKYLLGVEPPLEDDEDRITALDRGSMIHEILERFIDQSLPVEFGHKWVAKDRSRLSAIANEVCARYESEGRTGSLLVWETGRRELDQQLRDFLDQEQDFRLAHQLKPVKTEFGFGSGDNDSEPLAIELSDGRTVQLGGSIDRVDVDRNGSLVISDYKSGKQKPYEKITAETPLGDNDRLQLPIYAFAARAAVVAGLIDGAQPGAKITAAYWFFGVDSGKRTDVELTEETEQGARDVIEMAIGLMSRGVFPQQVPTVFYGGGSNCDFCAPNGRGADDVGRSWRRIKDDPALAEYVELAGLLETQEETE